jgi:hypothetical protein
MPDGRTLVVNAGTQELRFFDPAGAFLHSVGRQGQGPGEFQYPLLIPALEYDTIHVFDRAGRVVVFDSDGRLVRTHNVRMAFPVGILTNGRVLTDRNTALAGFDSPEGIVQNDVIYELVDPVSGASDTIAQVAGQALFLGNTDGRISFTQVPFDVPPNAATAGARFYVTPGEAAEVRVFDGAGVERERYRILLPAEPLSREAWDRIIVERVKGAPDQAGRAELERRYARMSPPAALPAIERILVDMAGHIWLERYSGDRTAPRQWFVLDATGRALGRVETPAGFVIEHIGRDFVLGRWPAGDDAERVGRYRLRRSPA